MKLSESQLAAMAAQLRCPSGEEGIMTGELMNASNANMITKTYNSLKLAADDNVLEIGPGNGLHVSNIIDTGIRSYKGTDISPVMIAAAKEKNEVFLNASFTLTDGISLPYGNAAFSKIFTVNTIYFWQQPENFAIEIARVLKPGGQLSVGYVPKRIMQYIPFAKYGFNLWDEANVQHLLESAGYLISGEVTETEFITGNTGQQIQRDFVVISATKL